jgi:hypothetical protein
MNNIFDYQGTLYENENSLDKIGTTLWNDTVHSCDIVESFCGWNVLSMVLHLIRWAITHCYFNALLSMHSLPKYL